MSRFALLPEPPYYAVIFANQAAQDDTADYPVTAARMVELAEQQSGFLGLESTRDAAGFGITVSYWRDEASIASWKAQVEHAAAREQGRARWYDRYTLRVAKIERAYGWSR
ncbi:MAG: antibiotic biosynthesis monooxygenase [Myxococcales bacterium]|nr:antibiotic biosynthesis monooxygenase [Myxococcales bacterium]